MKQSKISKTKKRFFWVSRKLWLLVAILIVAAALRLFRLGEHPISLNLDEVAIGYNAYSILNTGMDEYGKKFPIAFRSHDDYKAPFYIYASTIPIALFGLNGFAVRLTSALFGIIAVYVTYLLTETIVSLSRSKQRSKYRWLPLLSALLLAISPWHIQFSRAAFETNVATTMIIVGVLFFLKGKKQSRYWILTAIIFGVSLYTYHSNKIFIPLFVLVMVWHVRTKLKSRWRTIVVGVVAFLIVVAPLIPFSLSPEGRLRFKGTSVFNVPTIIETNHDFKLQQWRLGREYQAKLFHSEIFAGIQVFLRGYFSHFSYDFLFWGDTGLPKNHTPNVGLLYWWELPFLVAGFFYLFRDRLGARWIILGWFVLAPVASALTWDVPSSTRTTIILPTFQIITAIGIVALLYQLSLIRRLVASAAISLVGLFFLGLYLHNYYRIAPQVYADGWQYGYSEAIEYVKKHLDEVDQVIVSNRFKQPHNFFAFYLEYDPATYIEVDGGTRSGGFDESKNRFGKFQFKDFGIDFQNLEENTLYVGLDQDLRGSVPIDKEISLPNGEPRIIIFKK